jgi:hypothetical protein
MAVKVVPFVLSKEGGPEEDGGTLRFRTTRDWTKGLQAIAEEYGRPESEEEAGDHFSLLFAQLHDSIVNLGTYCLPSTVCPQLFALNCLPSTVCPQLFALN